jgi:hypothetical protein
MRTWLGKFRISAALDNSKPFPESLRRTIAGSEVLTRYEQAARDLDRALRQEQPGSEAPAFLHSSIMQAIRSADASVQASRIVPRLGWIGAGVTAALAALIAWFAVYQPAQPSRPAEASKAESIAAVSSAIRAGDDITRGIPAALVAPLSDELDRFNRDLRATADYLLASLP